MTKTRLVTAFKRAEDSPGFLLWRLTNKWQAQQRAALKSFGLTHVQFVLLATLTYAANKSSFTQKQLAQYAQVDVMMTSQVIRKLEEKGLIKREPSKIDARAFTINPTQAGIELANRTVKEVETVDRQFFGSLGADCEKLVTMMRRLNDA